MLTKTNGIVLHSLKYSENSSIVSIYTEQFGRVSYMVHGTNKKKSKFRSAFLQPLSLIDIDVFHVPGKDIQTIKDIRIYFPFSGIPYNPIKNSLALFISELLYRTLKRTEPDENLFNFVDNSVQALDCCEDGLANFHLIFLLKLTRYMGFEPNGDAKNEKYFDLLNGVYVNSKPLHIHFLDADSTLAFYKITQADYLNMENIILSREQRYKMLENIIEYYKLHVPDFHGLNSLAILKAIFN